MYKKSLTNAFIFVFLFANKQCKALTLFHNFPNRPLAFDKRDRTNGPHCNIYSNRNNTRTVDILCFLSLQQLGVYDM